MHEQQKMKRGGRKGATELNREKKMTWKRTEYFGQGWRQKGNKQEKEK